MATSLNEISLTKLPQAEIAGLARVHLWATGKTHEIMGEFSKQARAIVLKRGGADGLLDGAAGFQAQGDLMKAWGDTMLEWVKMFQAARKQAASLPWGMLAVMQNRMVRVKLQEALAPENVFETQIKLILDAASTRIYDDGLNLSGHIWKLDRESRDGINSLVMRAVAEKQSAWDLAKDLEQFLGDNEDCPRWTKNRLYKMSKKDIAGGDLEGLITGKSCDGQGVSYKALRLARTEIQAAHALAADAQMKASPWVEKERVVLSEGHPEKDICDEVVDGGEGGKGIYPVGTIILPLHPNCLCYKVAVTMSDADFTSQLRGWVNGTQAWPEMDRYAETIGGIDADLSKAAVNLAVWIFGEESEVERLVNQ